MKNSNGINGEGTFKLYVNNQLAQSKEFSKQNKEAISFNLTDFISEHMDDIFVPGETVEFNLEIDDYDKDSSASSDEGFKVSYSLNLEYYDALPPTGNTSLQLEVDRDFSGNKLGDFESNGKTFGYNFKLQNLKKNKGLLMVVLVFKVPSCLEVNYNQLSMLKESGKFDYYEVLHSNTEIVFYWRQM